MNISIELSSESTLPETKTKEKGGLLQDFFFNKIFDWDYYAREWRF